MKKRTPTRKSAAKQSIRLGAYLAAGLGASTVATPSSDAAIVNINIGPTGFNIGGINGGVTSGSSKSINSFPLASSGSLLVYNNPGDKIGLAGSLGIKFGVAPLGGNAVPRKFTLNATINSAAIPADFGADASVFRYVGYYGTIYNSPNFGPGSYMGFRTSANNYGWLEVTWTNASSQFQILSGAYESVANVAILAGATAPIPEPGTWVAMAVFAGGAAFARWRKRRDEAQQEAA